MTVKTKLSDTPRSTYVVGGWIAPEEYNPDLVRRKNLQYFDEMRIKDKARDVCDRCHNKKPYARARLPVDPATFCDNCHKETDL